MPDPAPLAAHLAWLKLKGRAERTIYDRKHAVLRLAAWLESYADGDARAGHGARGDPATGPCELHETPGPGIILSATAADLAAWRQNLTVSDSSVVTYACHVREFYAWAVDEGLRPGNPAARLPLPRIPRGIPRPVAEDDLMRALEHATARLPLPRIPRGIPRPVAEDDLMRALEHATARVRPWLVLAGWAGLRAKEIALLRRDCVMESNAPPLLLIAADSTKGGRERLVPLTAFVLDGLRLAGLPSSGYVFPRCDKRGGPNAPWVVSHLCSRSLRAAGVAATLHQLRHRYGTQFYRLSGHDLRLTQEMLGHSSPSTTAVYADWDRSAAAAVAESLPVPKRLRAVS